MTHSSSAIQPVLTVHDLTVQLPPNADRSNAVEHISFKVFAGQTTCLLGESGSGKSVIAQTVMRLLPPAVTPVQGSVNLLGEDVLAIAIPEVPRVARLLRSIVLSVR